MERLNVTSDTEISGLPRPLEGHESALKNIERVKKDEI